MFIHKKLTQCYKQNKIMMSSVTHIYYDTESCTVRHRIIYTFMYPMYQYGQLVSPYFDFRNNITFMNGVDISSKYTFRIDYVYQSSDDSIWIKIQKVIKYNASNVTIGSNVKNIFPIIGI